MYSPKVYRVTVREGYSVSDPATSRTLPLLARIPLEAPEPLPVVIFSHGGGSNDNGQHLSATWGNTFAEHGLFTIHIAHSKVTSESGAALCEIAGVPAETCVAGDSEDDNGFVALMKSRDIQTVIDNLPMLSQLSVENKGPALDTNRVAVAGWSGGSRGPVVLSGATFIPVAGTPAIGFRRQDVKAAIALSPAGAGFGGFFDDGLENSWQTMDGPVLIMTGTNDQKPDKPELTGQIRRQAFDNSPQNGAHWLLYSNLAVGVGGHATYNLDDLNASDTRLRSLSLAETSAALAFLDAFVNDNKTAKEWLLSGKAGLMAGDAQWSNR